MLRRLVSVSPGHFAVGAEGCSARISKCIHNQIGTLEGFHLVTHSHTQLLFKWPDSCWKNNNSTKEAYCFKWALGTLGLTENSQLIKALTAVLFLQKDRKNRAKTLGWL